MTNVDKSSYLLKDDFFKKLADLSPDGIFVHSHGRLLYANNAGLKLVKAKSFDEIVHIPVIDFVHPDYKEVVINRIKRMENEKTDVPPIIEKIIILDGSTLNVEAYGRYIEVGDIKANLLILRDITQYLEDQNKINENEIRNSAIFKAIPDLVFILSKDGVIVDYNIPEDSRQHMPRPQKKGTNLEEFVPKEILEEYLLKIKNTLETKETTFFEYELSIAGHNETFEARLIYYEKDKVLALIRNISERKAIEEEQKRELKIESLGLLAGGIAHDFNNILMKIIGNINLAKLELKNPENIVNFLNEMENATFQAKKLTSQLLTFSKGGDPLTRVESIKEIIEGTVTFFLSGSKSKVHRTYSDDKMTVQVESGQIEQVISNLIINADQSMPEGGLIDINVAVVDLTNEIIPGVIEDKYVRIAIADKGVGVKDEDKTKIFEPYYTTKKTGTGLGLTTCFSIVKKHHGYIEVRDNVDRGTIFIIYLPYVEQKVDRKIKDFKIKSSFSGKILIMDDSVEIQELLGKMLEYLGFTFDTALNGGEAIEKYQQAMLKEPYTLVIMDLTIPGGIGGKQALQQIRKFDPNVKAIVSSGYSNDPVLANYQEFGFIGVLPKPYSLNDLKKVITEVF